VKFALISQSLQRLGTGQAIALYRLLRHIPPDEYCIVSQRKNDPSLASANAHKLLNAHYHRVTELRQAKRGATWLARLRILAAMNYLLGRASLERYAAAIERVLNDEGCEAVIACSGNLWDIPAGFTAARRLGIRFYAYYFDWYAYQFYWYPEIAFARAVERDVMANADGVIVTNETLADDLHARYGANPHVLRNACDAPASQANGLEESAERKPTHSNESVKRDYRILYTGAIYGAQSDAVVNLLRALDLVADRDIKLHVYTSIPTTILRLKGISGKVVLHGYVPLAEIAEAQRNADILLLALSFKTHYHPEVIRTASPGKMSDYLASGKPILVHAPADSFVVRFFREHECGEVVDARDARTLAESVERLLDDGALRAKYVENAMECAHGEFDSSEVAKRFREIIAGK
jgi:glycosyltransferase involved in cell wall biosynthesis